MCLDGTRSLPLISLQRDRNPMPHLHPGTVGVSLLTKSVVAYGACASLREGWCEYGDLQCLDFLTFATLGLWQPCQPKLGWQRVEEEVKWGEANATLSLAAAAVASVAVLYVNQ